MRILPANKLRAACLLGALAVAGAVEAARQWPEGKPLASRPPNVLRLVSDSYRIERLYASMQGPLSFQGGIFPAETLKAERYYITGVKLRVVNPEATREESQEWFCHANLTLPGDGQPLAPAARGAGPPSETPLEAHKRLNPDNRDLDHRLFTLIPGRSEIQLPEGFGIPMSGVEPLELMTMALNLNAPHPDKTIRFSTDLSVSDNQALVPVFRRALYGHVTATPESTPRPDAMCVAPLSGEKALLGASCGPDMMDFKPARIEEEFGKNQIMHWIVPPGTHFYTNDVTAQIRLSSDTTIHYATGHTHPYGRALTLFERKPGGSDRALLTISVRSRTDRLGVEEISEIKTKEGIPVAAGSAYTLVSEYDNTSGKPIDAMAILYLYMAE